MPGSVMVLVLDVDQWSWHLFWCITAEIPWFSFIVFRETSIMKLRAVSPGIYYCKLKLENLFIIRVLVNVSVNSCRGKVPKYEEHKNRNRKRKLILRKRINIRMKGINNHTEVYFVGSDNHIVFFIQNRVNKCVLTHWKVVSW